MLARHLFRVLVKRGSPEVVDAAGKTHDFGDGSGETVILRLHRRSLHGRLFLDRDRQYSRAYFMSPDDSLDQAQERKKRHIAAKPLLEPGCRVLDIGSGWGGLALYLARRRTRCP